MKKGFTLAEMIGVIVIVSLLLVLIAPAMANFVFKSKEKLSESTMEIINSSAYLYMSDNYNKYFEKTSSVYCIQLQTLVDKDYLTAPIFDSKTNANVDLSKYVKVTYSDKWNYEYVSVCEEVIDDGSTNPIYFTWTETSTDATVTGFSASKPSGLTSIKIPSTYNGKPVKNIGNSAFSSAGLVSVELPDNLVSIGTSAFYLNSIAGNLEIPKKVTTIGNSAFQGNQISSIKLPTTVQTIGTSAFRDNLIVTLRIPNSVTSLGSQAFRNNKIETLEIGSGINQIATYVFRDNFIETLVIPNTINSVQLQAFYNNKINNLSLGTGVQTIGESAFAYNLLTTLTIPNNVTTISTQAFLRNSLTTLSIGSGVTTIDGGAFSYNRTGYNNIENIIINSNNFKVKDGVLYNSNYTVAISAMKSMTSYIVPSEVTSILGYAFYYNNLASVTFNTSTASIGNYAFSNNYIANTLSLPSTLTSIGTYAFYINSLAQITIPNSVTTIGMHSFRTNRLQTVNLGTGVTSIGAAAFQKNSSSSTTGNGPLTTIINRSGRSFDWDSIVNNQTTGLYTFTVGTVVNTYGNVTVSSS